MLDKKWYILFVKTSEEEKIAKILKKEQFNSFVPKMKMLYHKNGQNSLKEKVMFPGYVFIESELNQKDFIINLNHFHEKNPRFMKLLKVDNEGTAALYPEEKEYLEQLLNENKTMEHSMGIIEGDKVIILEGPLKGLESKIIKIDRHKRRALLEMMICNVATQVKVSLEIISKI